MYSLDCRGLRKGWTKDELASLGPYQQKAANVRQGKSWRVDAADSCTQRFKGDTRQRQPWRHSARRLRRVEVSSGTKKEPSSVESGAEAAVGRKQSV